MDENKAEMMQPSPEFLERMGLYMDTVACRRVDRICTSPMIMYLPIYLYGGVNVHDIMMDYSKANDCYIRYHQEYQPDLGWGPQAIYPGAALEGLDCQYIRWPGKQIADLNAPFQVVDREEGYMDPEEYLEYAEDPSGFIMRKLLPRHYKALQGLEMVDFSNLVWQGGLYGMIPFALPPVQQAFGALAEAGGKMMKMAEDGGKLVGMLAGMGFPSACDQGLCAPFDVFNDTMRGFMNTTMDVIEYPDELLVALEACTKIQVRDIKRQFARSPWMKNVVFFLHNGFDSFMSREQFETFYWPGLLACVNAVVECGGIPNLYVEDSYDSKMDILARDLPAGKCVVTLINCNVEKAKELFAGKICLSGGVNGVLLEHGSKEDVIKDVKAAIDLWAPGGGYYLNCDVSLDRAKPENLHALFDTARNYIKY